MKSKKRSLSLYIHIPFCIQKCLYCDFHSAPAQEEEKRRYTELLCREIAAWADIAGQACRIETIFIGGGTPTCLSVPLLRQIRDAVFSGFDCSRLKEFTVEANPGTVKKEHAGAFADMGINRVSLGLQSARDEELKRLGRVHNYAQFLDTYELLRRAGMKNINIDLMAAIPGQDAESYRDTLQRVAALEPEHISAYSLIVEPGTVFAEWEEQGILDRPAEQVDRAMYEMTGEYLQSQGYERYEISNYARVGRECLHNCIYWTGGEYLGLGENASSYWNGYRFCVPTERSAYEEYVGTLESKKDWLDSGLCDVVKVDVRMQMEEFMFLGLRMMKGVSCSEFQRRFGRKIEQVYGDVLTKFIRLGFLEKCGDGDAVCLTKRGIDISNQVLAEFLLDT